MIGGIIGGVAGYYVIRHVIDLDPKEPVQCGIIVLAILAGSVGGGLAARQLYKHFC